MERILHTLNVPRDYELKDIQVKMRKPPEIGSRIGSKQTCLKFLCCRLGEGWGRGRGMMESAFPQQKTPNTSEV